MDLKKLNGFENVSSNLTSNTVGAKADPAAGVAFQQALRSFENVGAALPTMPHGMGNVGSIAAPQATLKFSNHAVERMQSRGVYFNQDEIGKIQEAVGRAASKGSKDSLILTDKAALIVSVKNNTVVTVMDKTALKENVFTNIDSTIVM